MARLIAALVWMLSAAALQAQGWQGSTRDDGSYLHGMADFNQGALNLWCAAPSPQGLNPQFSDANLVEPMAPYAIRVMVGPALAGPQGTPRIEVVMWADGQGALMPMRVFGEEQNLWAADIPMDDPLITRLRSAQTLTLEVRGGTHWQIGTFDLKRPLQTALAHCIFGWRTAGHPLPAALAGDVSVDQRGVQTTFADPDFPQFILQGSVVTRYLESFQQMVDTACGGPGQMSDDAWRNNDLDGDGTEDHVVDWNEVRCTNGVRPHCANGICAVRVSLSSAGGAAPVEVLGKGPRFVPGPTGRAELYFQQLLTGCTTPAQPTNCGAATLHWNGQSLARR